MTPHNPIGLTRSKVQNIKFQTCEMTFLPIPDPQRLARKEERERKRRKLKRWERQGRKMSKVRDMSDGR